MTLEEAKNQTAITYKFESWKDLKSKLSAVDVLPFFNDAADLYAKSKWEEACKAQKWECERAANFDHPESLSVRILNAKSAQYVP